MLRKVKMHQQLRGTPSKWHPWTLSARKSELARQAELEDFNMAIVPPEDTGLSMMVYNVSKKSPACRDTPRIKVSTRYGDRFSTHRFSMTIADEPQVLAPVGTCTTKLQDLLRLQQFIVINKQVLLDYWHQSPPFWAVEMLEQLQPLSTGDFSTITPSHRRE
eukprot:jgi/Chrzof1/278/Cz01g09210.t1